MDLKDLKILVVDDNNINVKLLDRTLTNNNFNVVSASSGKEAIEVTNTEKPDLILLDVLMPGMDGYETCKILKESNETKHIPVIFLSAKNETVDKAKGLALGAADYLTKPFDPVEIVARIHSHIAIRKDVIDLFHKNEQLRTELLNAQNGKEKTTTELPLKNLEAIKSLNYRQANKYFRISARVKFAAPPVTTVFIPVYVDNQNYIYIISGGFAKDINTSFVQLLLQQFATGYFRGLKEKNFQEKDLYNVFDMILRAFSPDIYNAAFTLSMGHINAAKPEFTSFSIHQALPLILNENNNVINPDSLPVFYESKYAKIIKATKIKMRPKSTLVNYVSGKDITDPETMNEFCLPHFSSEKNDIVESIENCFSNLPEKENDQLVMAIKLL
ncbi:MAG: response regulator [Calditrichaeota bacterium]|nr:MAG: response regulator [Calditrichota bacterium]MBL1206685.1 response regulator [Calditrichota bacterium]NOG46512.1 response regulator [Calditrichota bacterium]